MKEGKPINPLAALPQGKVLVWLLNLLVVFNLAAQLILVLLLLMGPAGAEVAPLAGGAVVALFTLVFLYGRWLLPGLKGRQVIALVVFKELAVALLLGFFFGLILLIRFLLGG